MDEIKLIAERLKIIAKRNKVNNATIVIFDDGSGKIVISNDFMDYRINKNAIFFGNIGDIEDTCIPKELTNNYKTKENIMQEKKIIITSVFKELLNVNSETTTLEVKNYLIKHFTSWSWTQDDISKALDQFYRIAAIDNLSYTSNGKYRTYRLISNKTNSNKKNINKKEAIEILENAGGRFFTIVWATKDNPSRMLNGQVKKNLFDKNGYIKIRSSKGDFRKVNPNTIKSISLAETIYNVL